MRKDPGIKVEDVVVGTGEIAGRHHTVIANVRFFLNRGEEVTSEYPGSPRMRVDMGSRDCMAGLRYGIEGMRVGGKRTITISSHLAYGEVGVPDKIPPNAMLRCEVELLEVRERGVVSPEDYPPGKHLCVFHPGEAKRDLPRWQFGLDENGRCGAGITFPIPGCGWRHARSRYVEFHLDEPTVKALFEYALGLPTQFPNDCLPHEALWADASEKAGSITRDRQTNTLCVTVFVDERGRHLCYCVLRENSPAILTSQLYEVITKLLKPHLMRDKTT